MSMKNRAHLDLQGKQIGRLTVLRRIKVEGAHNAMWECLCDCGNITVGAASNIGRTKFSCGCLAKETASALMTKHGGTGRSEHRIWMTMKARCTNPNAHAFAEYGGRGIKVCDAWLNSFETFLKDMGDRPSLDYTLDRVETNGNYEPGNCRWATWEEQQNNRRNTVFIEFQDKKMTIRDAIKATGSVISIARIHGRLNAGWPVERALKRPLGPQSNQR